MKHKFILALLVMCCLIKPSITKAQKVAEVKKLSDTAWVQMMDDPNVVYIKAVENFEAYWKNKRKPLEENELFEEEMDKREEKQEKFTNPNEPAVKYFFEYKRFKHWQQEVKPYLKNDGTILTMDERIAIWKAQKSIKN